MASELDEESRAGVTRSRLPGERYKRLIQTVKSGSHQSIRDLARQFKLSESHLQHLFRAHSGSSLGRSLTEERLRRAADLLQQSDLSIKEIAYITGYKHPSSFIRAFDRFFRCSPSCYRQEMLTESSSC